MTVTEGQRSGGLADGFGLRGRHTEHHASTTAGMMKTQGNQFKSRVSQS
jgi:hypothetical protein